MISTTTLQSIVDKISSIPGDMEYHTQLKRITEILSTELGFFFVGLFLVNYDKGAIDFCVGTGDIGEQITHQGWTIPLNNRGPWIDPILTNEIRLNNWATQKSFALALENTTSAAAALRLIPRKTSFFSPLIANTIWQLCLPLKREEIPAGLLEMISDDEALDLDSNDIGNLTRLANFIGKKLQDSDKN